MPSLNEIVSDIELRLTKGKPSDDIELERDQIAAWVVDFRDNLVTSKLKEEWYKEGYINSFYLKRVEYLPLEKKISTADQDFVEYYVEIADKLLNVGEHGGIIKATDQSGNNIGLICLYDVDTFKFLKAAKPTHNRLKAYKEGNRVYLLGIEKGKRFGKVNLFVIPSADNIDPTEEFPIDSDLLPILKDMVEEVGRRQLQTPSDLHNDGQDA